MNYIPLTIFAYILNGVSVLASKFLLTKKIPHPISYVFYISTFSLITLLALPLTHTLSINLLILVSLSTIAWTAGLYLLFSALKIGLASRVAPLIGTLTPIFLIFYYSFTRSISLNEIWGTGIATLGLFIIILSFLKNHLKKVEGVERIHEISFEVFSGLFFALSYILLRTAYDSTDFLTGLVWSKFILIPILITISIIPNLRRLVFASSQDKINFLSKTGAIFIGGQISGGAAQLLITFAISLANPALVNSLQGVQYVFLFLAGIIMKQENFSRKILTQKIIGIVLIGFGLYILSFVNQSTGAAKKSTLGITFSPRYAQGLGLDPKLTFISILDDLSPKTLRIPIYWDEVEPLPNHFDFSKTDYYVREAEKRGIKLTLVIGLKVPRFPECYYPRWGKNLKGEALNIALLGEEETIVNHYKASGVLAVWQVENEPLFPFGVCPKPDLDRLTQEVHVVHQNDPNHPVMITESGEYGLWITSASLGDIVGSTLYRKTLAFLPQFKSPLPPFFYQFKGMIIHLIYPGKSIYVSELQGEPWANDPLPKVSIDYQKIAFPLKDLRENVEFAQEADFDTVYLWGAEWWYYLAAHNHPEYRSEAILIFKDIK